MATISPSSHRGFIDEQSVSRRPDGHVAAWPGATLIGATSLLEVPGADGTAVLGFHVQREPAYHEVVGFLLRSTLALWPAWLPEAEGIDSASGAGAPAVRMLARAAASRTDLFGPFLEKLALAATKRTMPDVAEFHRTVVLRECRKLLLRAYGQRTIAVVLEPPKGVEVEATALLLADAGFQTVLVGPGADGLRRIEPPAFPMGAAAGAVAEPLPRREFMSAAAGRPNPSSEVECRFEAFLAAQHWATGRAWNQTWAPSILDRPVRLDLLWASELCVVEIDGPEHTGADKFAADRRRDRLLQYAGYAVLRFTNAEVLSDMDRVGREIARYLERRRGGPNGA